MCPSYVWMGPGGSFRIGSCCEFHSCVWSGLEAKLIISSATNIPPPPNYPATAIILRTGSHSCTNISIMHAFKDTHTDTHTTLAFWLFPVLEGKVNSSGALCLCVHAVCMCVCVLGQWWRYSVIISMAPPPPLRPLPTRCSPRCLYLQP